jgi:Concanavalin A-like lectin/glucanases superfamily
MFPSYKTGFYARARRNGGKARYPQLWKGCVGAWAPCLGNVAYRFNDWSGSSNGGGFVGLPLSAWVRSYGQFALNFDGVDDYINLTMNPSGVSSVLSSLLQNNTSPRYSISAWMNTTTTSTDVRVFACGNTGGDLWMLTFGIGAAGTPQFYIRDETFTNYSVNGTSGTVNTGKWVHICVTRNLSAVRLYLNGLLVGSSNSFSHSFTTFNKYTIGAIHRSGPSGYFPGMIDSVAIYNRMLSQREVQLLAKNRSIAYELETPRSFLFTSTAQSRKYSLLTPRIIGVE